jgi:AraC family L-rhamnose operon regulatory protein RhaS
MRKRPPIYECSQKAYNIDTCAPQRRAIVTGKINFHAITKGHYPGITLSPETLPGVSSLGFWDAVGEQDWGLEPHRNEGIEIVLVETGHIAFEVEGVRHPLKAGNLTVTRPWDIHSLGAPNIGPGRLHWIILDVEVRRPNQAWEWPPWVILAPDDLRELTGKLRRSKQSVWKTTPEITEIFQALAECVQCPEVKRRVSRLAVFINHLLVALLDVLRAQKTKEDDSLVSIARTLELFLKDLASNPHNLSEPWSLDSMAEQCGMGSTTVVKYCRMLTNTSPMDYLNRCRLDHAAQRLLNAPALPIVDIAFECGFSSSQHFATQFRRRQGCSPKEYRNRLHPRK